MSTNTIKAIETDFLSEDNINAHSLIDSYLEMDRKEIISKIQTARKTLGEKLFILGHHYQQDDIIQFADATGDSFELSRKAAATDAEYIIFCGVHFMAETADILTSPSQTVILPDLSAGCSMADMAIPYDVRLAWRQLQENNINSVTPITYMNSAAELKKFCGDHHGAVCTSSNADRVLTWALKKEEKVFFFPDQHLGRWTARQMGISPNEIVLWKPRKQLGGNTVEKLKKAKIILWEGHCSVHQNFRPEHLDTVRKLEPDMKIIVHPECCFEVCEKADIVGSTAKIKNLIEDAPAGAKWAVGTENHLVDRLAKEHPEQTIILLSPFVCQCSTMYRISPPYLAMVMEGLVKGKIIHPIKVSEDIAQGAKLALDRMLSLPG